PSATGDCRVLRDPTGALPCFRMEWAGLTIVFSWLEDVLELLRLPAPPVCWDAVAAMLVFRQLGAHETALAGVSQILPGELTSVHASSSATRVHWSALDVARRHVDPEPQDAVRRLRETTTECVRAWGACYDAIVLRLSGGIDSAIMLSCLCTPSPTSSIVCLNYFSDGADGDERGYARLAATRAGCVLVERQRDGSFHLEEVLHPARTPIPSSHLGRMGSDRMDAEVIDTHGASALFTGAGGDQLFQEARSTWPAADYLQVRGLDRGFPAAALDAARLARVSFWRAMHLAFRDRFTARDPLEGAGQFTTLVPREVIDCTLRMAHRFVHPALLAAHDLPIGKLNHLRALICPFEYHNPFAPHRAHEVVPALMSQPLLEVCLTLPTYVLTRGGRGRALARDAFADLLPPEVANRRSKGSTDDHATSVLIRSLPLVKGLLLDGQLARNGLLDRSRVESALEGRASTTGTYVAELHACFAMEAWLQSVKGGVLPAPC
ncbi:MAG TPA: asparagine synthase-related protein, partial [Roseateles sp.]|nr:asparagine synthase-related protein [Roseateles sp.]